MKHFSILITFLFFTGVIQHTVFSGDYTLVNKTGSGITGIYIASAGTDNWLAIGSAMTNGQKISFTFDAASQNCQYNIKYKDGSGKENIIESIDMCSAVEIILNSSTSTETGSIKLPIKKDK